MTPAGLSFRVSSAMLYSSWLPGPKKPFARNLARQLSMGRHPIPEYTSPPPCGVIERKAAPVPSRKVVPCFCSPSGSLGSSGQNAAILGGGDRHPRQDSQFPGVKEGNSIISTLHQCKTNNFIRLWDRYRFLKISPGKKHSEKKEKMKKIRARGCGCNSGIDRIKNSGL